MAKAKVFTPCALHHTVEAGQKRIEDKLDEIIKGQVNHDLYIQHLKDTVDNGLKSTVNVIKERVDDIKDRVGTLENFSWFNTWITQLRDGFFIKILKLAFYGGLGVTIIWFIFNFGKQGITKILGG